MLPTLPSRLTARSFGPALLRQGSLAPPSMAEMLVTTELARRTWYSAKWSLARCSPVSLSLPLVRRSTLDSSAEASAPAAARSRAFVHVAFTSIQCLDDPRRQLTSDGQRHTRQRPRPFAKLTLAKLDRGNPARRAASLLRCVVDACPALLPASLAAAHSAPAESAVAGEPCGRLRSVGSRGEPSNHERASVHEKRNVGECLAARGVQNCHH